MKFNPQLCASGLSLSRQRVGQSRVLGYVMVVRRGTASLTHSHLLYIPDGWERVHPLRRVQRSVHVCGTEGTGHRQRADRPRVTVHGAAAAVGLAQLLLDQLPLFSSAVLEPDFHLKRQEKSAQCEL